MANKRKTTTAIVAGVTAVALLLGSTFAWTSISQQAKNESAGIVNVGGRLHDDFDGTNKDVYVENFTDPLDGGQPIYARVRLDEYMEVGKEAGQADNADRNAVPVVDGTDINDVKTWIPHKPAENCAVCETEGTCAIHDHWKWEMGGQTNFMPTFNKDKDSLAADINGTYHGTDESDKIYYDDYVVYTTDSANGGNDIAEAEKETYDGEIYSVVGTEYYDDDTDTEDNGGTRQVADVTHTAKQTANAEIMTMQAWIDAGSQPGNYWVYDEDGWAYWANPIMPGEATGLLLSNIEMEKNPGEKCYYAINVVGQFATVNDWEYFYNENNEFDGTDNALTLLEIASKNVATVTVTNLDGITTVEKGATVRFGASVSTAAETATLAESDFDWSVLDADHNVSTTSNITENEDGTATLTVGTGETSTELIIVARSNTHSGAVGFNAVAVNVTKTEQLPSYDVKDETIHLLNVAEASREEDPDELFEAFGSIAENGFPENIEFNFTKTVDGVTTLVDEEYFRIAITEIYENSTYMNAYYPVLMVEPGTATGTTFTLWATYEGSDGVVYGTTIDYVYDGSTTTNAGTVNVSDMAESYTIDESLVISAEMHNSNMASRFQILQTETENQPELTITITSGDAAVTKEHYMVTKIKDSEEVTSVIGYLINSEDIASSVEYTITATYQGADGIIYGNSTTVTVAHPSS